MEKSMLKYIIFFICFFNVISAQFTPISTILDNINLTTTCKTSITSVANDENISKCLPMFTIISTISQLLPPAQKDPETTISILAQLVQQTCSSPKCSSSLVQNTTLMLQGNCSQDLLRQNMMATLNLLLFSHYKPIQELICKRDNSEQFNPYCILETLKNIGTYNANLNKRHVVAPTPIVNPDPDVITITSTLTSTAIPTFLIPSASETPVTTLPTSVTPVKNPSTGDGDNSINNPPSSSQPQKVSPPSFFKTLETLPNSIVCTDCNKAMVSVVLNYLKENPTALNGTQIKPIMIQQGSSALGLKCGSAFLDTTTPKTISSSSKLLLSYFYNFIGIITASLLL